MEHLGFAMESISSQIPYNPWDDCKLVGKYTIVPWMLMGIVVENVDLCNLLWYKVGPY